jgi:hypothetical protein
MRFLVAISGLAVVLVLAGGCASPGSAGKSAEPKTQPVPVAASVAPAPSTSPDVEMTVCADFDRIVMPGIAATLHDAIGVGKPNPPYAPAEADLLRDDSDLSHWSYLVLSQADDASFANYLADAGTAVGVLAAPYSTDSDAVTAAQDIGHVNGYCIYDAS